MTRRFTLRAFSATAALFAVAACTADAPLATVSNATPQLARGGSSTPAVSVAGTWTGTYRNPANPSDTAQWSLYLTQRSDRLGGGLTRIVVVNGTTFAGVSAIKRGSIAGRVIALEFDRGEGAETAFTFSGTVNSDGRSMTGFHSRYPGSVALTRR